jgi:hypothetical protein
MLQTSGDIGWKELGNAIQMNIEFPELIISSVFQFVNECYSKKQYESMGNSSKTKSRRYPTQFFVLILNPLTFSSYSKSLASYLIALLAKIAKNGKKTRSAAKLKYDNPLYYNI